MIVVWVILLSLGIVLVVGIARFYLSGPERAGVDQGDSVGLLGLTSAHSKDERVRDDWRSPEDQRRERFSVKVTREANQGPKHPPSRYTALVREELMHRAWNEGDREIHAAADREFEGIIAESIPPEAQARAFYAKITGTKHRNSDGTSRPRIINECALFETFSLRPEPENKFDPNAIAILRRPNGEQLGYVDARLAEEITADQAKHGPQWMAILRHKNYHPETDRVVGATLLMIRLTDEYAAQKEAETPGSIIG